ncbi:putative transporter SLY41 [Pseudozyma hubeiensis]|nr:putative transporter SLY41 [Pseudozyma hubeiensis]
MNAAFMSARSRALEAISRISNGSSSTSLPTTSWRSTVKPKRSFDRPRLFPRNRSDLDASSKTPSRSTVLFVLGCLAWYTSSSLSSNTSKSLLSKTRSSSSSLPPAFPYPVTLTLIHFVFVNVCCFICASPAVLGRHTLTRLSPPSIPRISSVAQLAFFNVLGQALSSLAISRVPVATVHTIKALSPLFTVLSYTYLFNVTYSSRTYLSLVPLTMGVMMACTGFSFDADDVVGFAAALASTFVFVAQNIYSKKLLRNPSDAGEKMDKLNILFYSSACSIVLMIPMALYYDGSAILTHPSWRSSSSVPFDRSYLVLRLLLVNGLVHFAQNILAFNVLSLVSPVTYSIASLVKRVFVIVLAIIWFRQSVTGLQWVGIAMTFAGLWMYNNSKTQGEVDKAEKKVARKQEGDILPLTSSGTGGRVEGLHHRDPPPAQQYPTMGSRSAMTYKAPIVGGWNDIPESMMRSSYIKDPTKSLPSPPDSDKEV